MKEKILSIIVPSYNMEKYLPKCLGSLIVAPELMEELEVLVVNDGSKDRTSEIAHEFAAKWPGTFKVIDKKNGNYGSCINAALPIATGKYVKVLDADDWFATAAFEEYLRFLEKEKDVDLVVTNYDTVGENDCVTKQHRYEFDPVKEFSNEVFLASKSYLPMHALTYRTALLCEMGYRQLEGVSYTDTEWSFLPLAFVDTVRYCPETVYKYFFGRAGQTMEAGKIAKSWWMRGELALHLLESFNEMCADNQSSACRVLEKRADDLIVGVYRGGIFGNNGVAAQIDLNDFDARLKTIDATCYRRVGEAIYSRHVPYRFVRGWREQRGCRLIMELVCKVYSLIVYRGADVIFFLHQGCGGRVGVWDRSV